MGSEEMLCDMRKWLPEFAIYFIITELLFVARKCSLAEPPWNRFAFLFFSSIFAVCSLARLARFARNALRAAGRWIRTKELRPVNGPICITDVNFIFVVCQLASENGCTSSLGAYRA